MNYTFARVLKAALGIFFVIAMTLAAAYLYFRFLNG